MPFHAHRDLRMVTTVRNGIPFHTDRDLRMVTAVRNGELLDASVPVYRL